jgi:hypothetical protein
MGRSPDKGYLLELPNKERDDLYEYLTAREIIPNRDLPAAKDNRPEFKDRQLDMALEYLRRQVKTPARAAGP